MKNITKNFYVRAISVAILGAAAVTWLLFSQGCVSAVNRGGRDDITIRIPYKPVNLNSGFGTVVYDFRLYSPLPMTVWIFTEQPALVPDARYRNSWIMNRTAKMKLDFTRGGTQRSYVFTSVNLPADTTFYYFAQARNVWGPVGRGEYGSFRTGPTPNYTECDRGPLYKRVMCGGSTTLPYVSPDSGGGLSISVLVTVD